VVCKGKLNKILGPNRHAVKFLIHNIEQRDSSRIMSTIWLPRGSVQIAKDILFLKIIHIQNIKQCCVSFLMINFEKNIYIYIYLQLKTQRGLSSKQLVVKLRDKKMYT